MALENKLMVDAQGRHRMNDFQRSVWINEQVLDHVQRVLLAIKNAGYKLPELVTVSVDGIVGHLTDNPTIKKAIIKRARKAGFKMADVEITPNMTPEQIKALEEEALKKLDVQEDKVDAEEDPAVKAALKQIDNDLEAILIAEKPEERLKKKDRRARMAVEHLEAKTVLEAAARLAKSASAEDRKAAKNAMELLMGPDPSTMPLTKEQMKEELDMPSPAQDFFAQTLEQREAAEKEAAEKAEKAKKTEGGEGQPGAQH